MRFAWPDQPRLTTSPLLCPCRLPFVSRPKTVDDVAHQTEIITNLKGAMESGNVSKHSHLS